MKPDIDFKLDDSDLGNQGGGLIDLVNEDKKKIGTPGGDPNPLQSDLDPLNLDEFNKLALDAKEEVKAEVIEEVKQSEVNHNFVDVMKDSHYPLMTKDPALARDFTVKINN